MVQNQTRNFPHKINFKLEQLKSQTDSLKGDQTVNFPSLKTLKVLSWKFFKEQDFDPHIYPISEHILMSYNVSICTCLTFIYWNAINFTCTKRIQHLRLTYFAIVFPIISINFKMRTLRHLESSIETKEQKKKSKKSPEGKLKALYCRM